MKLKFAKIKTVVIYWLTSHPWLKFISLILAVTLWFYVRGELIQVH